MHHNEFPNFSPIISGAQMLIFFLMATPGVGFAQPVECTDHTTNVLRFENCGFNSGIAGWSALFGDNATANSVEGNPSPGSYAIDSLVDDEGDRATTIVSPCVPISPSSTYQIEGQFKLMDPLDAVFCEIAPFGYSDDNCTSPRFDPGHSETMVTGSAWTTVSETYVSRPVDSSMKLFATCFEDASGPIFTLLMDNFIADGPDQIPSINAGMNDAWVSADAPFQGFFFTVFPDLGLLFMALFTFDSVPPGPGVPPAVFGAIDQRWVSGLGSYSGNSVTMEVELTSGGIFNASDPLASQESGYGTITIVFINCNEALLTYDFPGLMLSGKMTLTRVLEDNILLCQALNAELQMMQ